MSESTPRGPTALLIVSPFVILAIVLFGAIKCASKTSPTKLYLKSLFERKHNKRRDQSSSNQSKDDKQIDLENCERRTSPTYPQTVEYIAG